MSRFLITGAVAVLGLGSLAQAEAQTRGCQTDQVAGAVVGSVVGGVVGGAIANDRRGVRRGFRRGHNRGYRRGYRRGNNGAGVLIGVLAGGLIGSQLARGSQNCSRPQTVYAPPPPPPQSHGQSGTSSHGYGQQSGRVLSGGPLQGQPVDHTVQTECRMTERYVNLPDGTQAIEPIQVCRDLPNGAWIITANAY